MSTEIYPRGYPHCVTCRKVMEDCGCNGYQGAFYPDDPALKAQLALPGIAPADSVDGRDRAPDRYTRKGRETIDRMRDLAHDHEWEDAFSVGFSMADILFAYHCRATALKYEDRDGAKGDPGGIAFPALILLAIYRLALDLLRVGRTE